MGRGVPGSGNEALDGRSDVKSLTKKLQSVPVRIEPRVVTLRTAPWTINPDDTDGTEIFGPGRYICDCDTSALALPNESRSAMDRANAAFIVRACNSHAALVAALERYVEADGDGGQETNDSLHQTGMAALALGLWKGVTS
jgi:hypothetical protein